MSTGDEQPAEGDDAEEEATEAASFDDRIEVAAASMDDATDEEALEAAIEAIGDALEVAGTEVELDEVEALLGDLDGAVEAADLPEPDDEDEEAPTERLESEIGDLRSTLESARGPYAEDVIATVETAAATLADTEWTEAGKDEALDAVVAFVGAVEEIVEADLELPDDLDGAGEGLEASADAVEAAGLDPDDDAGTIEALIEATGGLEAGLDEAEEWSDLTTREQLDALGFYDVLGHRKDYPPEWSALKEHEKRGNVEMVLLALEKLGMDFMEQHCLEALKRMADEAAVEPMLERAERRDRPAIEVLGKIGSEEAVETLTEYVGTDSDPQLQKSTLKALGEIGSEEATQAVADALAAENPIVRSFAARSLGMIGDTRAIDPLSETLESDDEDTVRASAAWALCQIGTERALEAASAHEDDRSYLVQSEAQKARRAMGSTA